MKTTIFVVIAALATLGAIGLTTAIMNSATTAHAATNPIQCPPSGPSGDCRAGGTGGPTGGVDGPGGGGGLTISSSINGKVLGFSGGSSQFGGGHLSGTSCVGSICP